MFLNSWLLRPLSPVILICLMNADFNKNVPVYSKKVSCCIMQTNKHAIGGTNTFFALFSERPHAFNTMINITYRTRR